MTPENTKNDTFLCTSKKYISHSSIGVKFWYVILGMRRFAVKNLLLQLFWGYPKNGHNMTGLYVQYKVTKIKKWNESGFRPLLCTYRLDWARRTSWGWWDKWDDTVHQTQDSKFELWRSEAEHATSRSRSLPTILSFTRGWGRNIFVSFKPPRPGTEPRTLAWKAAVLTTTLGPPPKKSLK